MKIYFSFPVAHSGRNKSFNDLSKRLVEVNPEAVTTMWKNSMVYQESFVTDCDIFVFKPLTNKWKFNISELPIGVKRELLKALDLNKDIYMVYKNGVNVENFYKVVISNYAVEGVQGTTQRIFEKIKKTKTQLVSITGLNYVVGNPCAEITLDNFSPIMFPNYNRYVEFKEAVDSVIVKKKPFDLRLLL